VISYLQGQEGIHFEVKAWKVSQGALWQCSVGNLFGRLAINIEYGIFHGISTHENRKISASNGFLRANYYRVGVGVGSGRHWLAPAIRKNNLV
jgi:hypothetical protein